MNTKEPTTSLRLPIKPRKDEPRGTDLKNVPWPATTPIPLPSGAEAVVSVVLPPPLLRCASCGQPEVLRG